MTSTDPIADSLRASISVADARLSIAKATHDATEIQRARLAYCDALRALGEHVGGRDAR